jgi:hypothetical protein
MALFLGQGGSALFESRVLLEELLVLKLNIEERGNYLEGINNVLLGEVNLIIGEFGVNNELEIGK